MKRENFKSRLGFILVSAGCAIGLGNVWKFPYICAANGGAAFIVIYLIFLAVLGLPLLIAEFAIGRGSGKSLVSAYNILESKESRFHNNRYFGLIGSYLLMMFYTMVCGWMIDYTVKAIGGKLSDIDADSVAGVFGSMLSGTGEMVGFTIVAVLIAFGVCALGLNKGVEKVTNIIMIALFVIMIVLAVNSFTLDNAAEGLKYYLVPDFSKITENGLGNVLFTAMSHAFFTLGIGVGSMSIFGSYLKKERKLTGESLSIVILDTLIALTAGLIIIPACVSYDVPLTSGPPLLFISLPNVFNEMTGGRIWMSLFFVFMTFAALSTVIAVYENIIAMFMDLTGISRKKAVAINIPLMAVLSMPAVLGYNVFSDIQPLGEGTTLMDMEDFILSNNILPLGTLTMILFCTRKCGWGWDNFMKETNTGKGISFPDKLKFYMSWLLPAIIIVVYIKGYYDYFTNHAVSVRILTMVVALLLLAVTLYWASPVKKSEKNKA